MQPQIEPATGVGGAAPTETGPGPGPGGPGNAGSHRGPGGPLPGHGRWKSALVRGPIDGVGLLAAVADPAAGGNVLFVGTARAVTGGVVTVGLEYEAHEPLASAGLERLAAEAVARFALAGCAIEHRLGRVAIGAASVGVATSAVHRAEAFAAAEWLMEAIKREVPIWKCEEEADGTRRWLHPPGATPGEAAPAGTGGRR